MAEINPQKEFLKFIRFERGLLACDEVSSYGCRADVLAVDQYKKTIIEYEFKNNSHDLIVAESRKSKYGTVKRAYKGRYMRGKNLGVTKNAQRPHRFYFVVPEELYYKEKEYLSKQKCGAIMYMTKTVKDGWGQDVKKLEFVTMKRCFTRKTDLQKYDVVVNDILRRSTSAYTTLLTDYDALKKRRGR